MLATAELQIIPIGRSVSLRREITRVIALLRTRPLHIETHASGTNIEGDLHEILDAVESVHMALHEEGSVRILSYLKLETRTDKIPTLRGKQL